MKHQHLLAVLALASGLAVAAEPPVGFVKTVSGDASVTFAGQSVKAEVGTPVQAGAVLRTGARSSLGVTFRDETVMSFGPDTELTVSEYLYAPGQGQLKMHGRLARGSLNYVSGVIAKLRPDAVAIETPSGTLGIRGTHLLIKVEE